MNALIAILLLSSLPCVIHRSPGSSGALAAVSTIRDAEKLTDESPFSLAEIYPKVHRHRRSIIENVTNAVENFASDVLGLPGTIVNDIARVVRYIYSRIEPMVRSMMGVFTFLPRLENATSGIVQEMIAETLQQALKFLTTEGLPILHQVLDTYEESGSPPASVRTAIDDFNAVYSILQTLGIVQPSAR